MNPHVNVDILKNIMLSYAEEEMPLLWVFLQDNNPKHTTRNALQWFLDYSINIMKWPVQTPDLNPFENL